METKRKYIISEPTFPIDGYIYNVQVWISVDGGENYAYCGIGKFCKSIEEATRYIENYHNRNA